MVRIGSHVTWHYRSAIGHGTVIGVHKQGTNAANTEYAIRQHDHHPGESSIVYHYGRALTVARENPRRERNFLGFGRSKRKEYTVDELRQMQIDTGKSLCEREQFKRALDTVQESPARFAKGIGARVSTAARDAERAEKKAAKREAKETSRRSYRDQYNAAKARLEEQGKKVEALEGGNKGAYQAALRKYNEIEREVEKMKKPKRNPYKEPDWRGEDDPYYMRLYREAQDADDRFVTALKKQFSRGIHPGSYRYGQHRFNAETRAAADRFLAASARLHDYVTKARNPKDGPFPDWRKMIRHPGALHRKLGVPVGEDIPRSLIKEAIAHPERFEKTHAAQERLKKEAVLARTFGGFKHRNPSDKQIKYLLYLLDKNGYSTRYMDSRFKELGATMRERSGTVENWLRGLDYTRTRELFDALKPAERNPSQRRKNPEADLAHAEHLYEQFHGREPHRIGTFDVDTTIPADLAELGILTKIKISGSGRMLQMLTWKPIEAVRLAADPDSQSLYIIGSRQRLPDNCLGELEREFGEAAKKNQFIIGTISQITYQTKKGFDKFETIDYFHDLGEETGEKPLLVYDRPTERLLIVGGAYKIKPDGIIN